METTGKILISSSLDTFVFTTNGISYNLSKIGVYSLYVTNNYGKLFSIHMEHFDVDKVLVVDLYEQYDQAIQSLDNLAYYFPDMVKIGDKTFRLRNVDDSDEFYEERYKRRGVKIDIDEPTSESCLKKIILFFCISVFLVLIYSIFDLVRTFDLFGDSTSSSVNTISINDFPQPEETQSKIENSRTEKTITDRKVMMVSSTALNLRADAGIDKPKIVTLERGDRVILLGESKDVERSEWLLVEWHSQTGWVNGNFLTEP